MNKTSITFIICFQNVYVNRNANSLDLDCFIQYNSEVLQNKINYINLTMKVRLTDGGKDLLDDWSRWNGWRVDQYVCECFQ